jgi:single-stranded-DNA-specific exonuclease
MSDDEAAIQWQEPSAVTVRGSTSLVRALADYWTQEGAVESGRIQPSEEWLRGHRWLADEWATVQAAIENKQTIVVYGDKWSARAAKDATQFVKALRKAKAKVIYLRNVKAPVVAQIAGNMRIPANRVTQMLDKPAKLHDPALLTGMDRTVEVVKQALAEKRKIAVYGDFDCDGVTGTAILTRALRAAGAEVVPYIPAIDNEGYGLHEAAFAELAAQGVGMVISTDCGTSSVDVVAGRPAGMLVAITDHHLPLRETPGGPEVLAPADSLINPEREGDTYPNKELSGSAVAWKVVCELENQGVVPAGTADSLLSLAAIGTVGDVMELRKENRTIVTRGLVALQEDPSPGLAALLEVAKLNVPRPLTSEDLAFQLIPRINAAGRMDEGQVALDLLLTDSKREAKKLAKHLNELNTKRKDLTRAAIEQAKEQIAEQPADAPCFVVHSPDWRKGIVGAMAGRLAEEYNRPVVCIAEAGEDSKGSARSKGGVKIVDALRQVADTMTRYGGHDEAAGFSIDAARIPEFAARLSSAIGKRTRRKVRANVITPDAVIVSKDINHRTMEQLARFEPFGNGNERPVFEILNAEVVHCDPLGPEGAAKGHWKVTLIDGTRGKGEFKAVIWNDPTAHDKLMTWDPETESWTRGKMVDICGTLAWNGWTAEDGQYRQYPQFTVEAYRAHEPQAVEAAYSRQVA